VLVAKRTPSKIAVYNNVLDGMSDYATRYTASTGVQTYYGSADLIVDGNTFNNLRSGVSLFNGWTQTGIAAGYFTQVTNNRFQNSNEGLTLIVDTSQGPTQQTYTLGTIFRDNSATNVASAAKIFPTNLVSGGPYANMNVFEQNTLGSGVPSLSTLTSNNNVQNNLVF
jgi:hypothetical protein